tara:strand:+ start:115 stop:459 length:345 start_codon:yes stop_codon:yes gene_type:complete
MTFSNMIPVTFPRPELKTYRDTEFRKIQLETGSFIEYRNKEPQNNRPQPFIYIQSQNEKNLNLATIKVQGLIIQLIVESEKKKLYEINDLCQQNQHLNLLVADRELQIKELKRK